MKTVSASTVPGRPIDPLIKQLTSKQVAADAAEFKRMLDSKVREHKLHEFLASHSYFFNRMLDPYVPTSLYSKVKLGHDYEVDFAWLHHDSFGPEWRLIEIEKPSTALFTKAGNASATLTHAIQQTRDWCDWIHQHLEYAQRLMPRIKYPFCYVFLGRRDELTPGNKERLKRFRYDHRKELEIHTLDWFVRSAEWFGNSIGPDGPFWQLPMKVMTHRDLKRGLPEEVQKWVSHDSSEMMTDYRLGDRESRYYRNNEPGVVGYPESDHPED
jgi:Shedu protein SduA, C-terminal